MTSTPTSETRRDYGRPHRPAPIAWANQLGTLCEPLGLCASLSPEGLLATARRRAGLEDLGGPPFDEAFERLLDSIENEASLHPLGRFMVRENLLRVLQNRLRAQDDFFRHPDIGASAVEDPIFIVGLQRTGTTLLQRLLSQDPAHRHLASWEALNVAPHRPPTWARWLTSALGADGLEQGEGAVDPRRLAQARIAERSLAYLAPDFFAIHPVEAEAPEEDVLLLEYSFYSTVPEATLHVPSYAAWLETQEQAPAYRYYRRLLRYLQWQRPSSHGAPAGVGLPRWLLKTPHHLEHLDALLEVFPRAKIIMTHRDPVKALASFCSMMAHGRGVFSDDVDAAQIGAQWSRKTHRMISRALEVREAHPDAFFDVSYGELVADPLAALRRIYEEFLGRSWDGALAQTFAEHGRRNPQHKYGRHVYALSDFGLDEGHERGRFASYSARFAIPEEAAG